MSDTLAVSHGRGGMLHDLFLIWKSTIDGSGHGLLHVMHVEDHAALFKHSTILLWTQSWIVLTWTHTGTGNIGKDDTLYVDGGIRREGDPAASGVAYSTGVCTHSFHRALDVLANSFNINRREGGHQTLPAPQPTQQRVPLMMTSCRRSPRFSLPRAHTMEGWVACSGLAQTIQLLIQLISIARRWGKCRHHWDPKKEATQSYC